MVTGLDLLLPHRLGAATPNSEREAQDVYDHAKAQKSPLPVGYIVKAVLRCNQLDTFRMLACDWSQTIEARHESVEATAKGLINTHLKHAHPYLASMQRAKIINATMINLSDYGR